MTANNQSLLHQLTSDTSNTSVPGKPSTSVFSTRLSHQVSSNPLHDHTDPIKSIINQDCVSENDNSSFATPIEAIFIPDIKIEPDVDECEISLDFFSKYHDADMQPPIQIDNPENMPPSSVSGTERLQHPQVPHQLTSHTSNTLFSDEPSFPNRPTIQFPITTNSSSLFELNLFQYLVKKFNIKNLTIRMSRLSDQVLESLQQNGTVDCNVVDNQMSEQRSVSINLEPVDPCDFNTHVSENLSSTVDDDDIEVLFEAICDPVVKLEPDLDKSEPSSDLSADKSDNHHFPDNTAVTVKQEEIGNDEEYSEVQPGLPELETLPEISNLSSNKDLNTIDPVFSCAHCIFMTNCKSKIRSHIANQHVKMSRYQCQECGKSYEKKNNLRRHISRVHPNKCSYKCLLCKRGFELEKKFNAHIQNHGKPFQCDVCSRILSSKHALVEHKMTIHTKSLSWSCDMCSKILYTDRSLKKHKRAVHSNLSYKCDICDKSFKLKPHLRAHQREVHAPVRAFSCNQCEKTFVIKSSLKRHSAIHSDLRPFKCEKCGASFNQSGHLTNHIRTVHSNVRAFKCHLCDKSFKSKCQLSLHVIRHSDLRPFSCDKCSFAFKSKSDLKVHQLVHSNVRMFECCQCESKFKYRHHLSVHIKTKH